MTTDALTLAQLHDIDAYWRAANYLSVGQIYLQDNPLLREPLTLAHIKPQVGHWGQSTEHKPHAVYTADGCGLV